MYKNKIFLSENCSSDFSIFFIIVLISCVTITETACKKLVDIPAPHFAITGNNVYTEDATAIAVLNGIYADISSTSKVFSGARSISFYGGLSSDELTLYDEFPDEALKKYYQNE